MVHLRTETDFTLYSDTTHMLLRLKFKITSLLLSNII